MIKKDRDNLKKYEPSLPLPERLAEMDEDLYNKIKLDNSRSSRIEMLLVQILRELKISGR